MKIFDRMNVFKSLRMQLMLYFVSISFLVLSIGSYLTYRNMLDMFEQRNEELILQQFAQTEQNILNLLEEVNRLSGVLLLDENVQKFLEISEYSLIYKNVETVRNIQKRADDIIINYPYINSIYLFTDNREVIGTSKINSLIIRKDQQEHPFFSTEIFDRFKFTNLDSIWYGGYKEDFFNEFLRLNNRNFDYLLTQAKGVKAITAPNRKGVLVLNINESFFSSIYGGSGTDTSEDTYVIDQNGKIISCADKKNIGKISEVFEKVNNANRYGSITIKGSKIPRQLIYYKLEDLKWYILREVPLSLDSQSSFSLQKTFIFVLLMSVFSIFIASYFWLRKIMYPLNSLAVKMSYLGQGNIGLTLDNIPNNELGMLIKRFNNMSTSIARLIRENKKMEEEKRELEIEALQSQINPHFLYNTLNMIKWMAVVIKAKNIVDSLVALGNILRPIFRSNDTMCTLKDEVTYLKNYVKIMNWRFGNVISFDIDMSEGLMNYKVPRFILQPLVENSITHGLKDEVDFININIKIIETGKDLLITVTDTGQGIPEEDLKQINSLLSSVQEDSLNNMKKGIGIYNVNRRIQLYYGNEYGLHLESSTGGGTKALLRIYKIL